MKTITNHDFQVAHFNPEDQKLLYEYAKAMKFDIKQKGRKGKRDMSLINLLKSPAIMASVISTILLSYDPNELCDRLKLLIQEKQAGNNSKKINEEIFAIAHKLIESKSISTKQHEIMIKICLI